MPMPTRISIIAAIADHCVIGLNNTLPWHLPEDLKRFRALTMGHHIIMGRKTFDSLGRLLPGRTTVIVSRQPDYQIEGAIVCSSLPEAVKACAGDEEVFIIGGAEIYRAALPMADRMYLTEIHEEFSADAWFPEFDRTEWQECTRENYQSADGLAYSYVHYERVKP